MKAKRVKGLDPDASFRENAQLMARVRADEMWKLGRKSQDPREVKAAHDARIAAKRLRYLLEITEPCFGRAAKDGAKVARGLQDILGEIHDCDVLSERVRARAAATPVDDERYVGLEALASYLDAKRRVLHRQYAARWNELEQNGYRETLERGLA